MSEFSSDRDNGGSLPKLREGTDPWALGAIMRMTGATIAGIAPEDWRIVSTLPAAGISIDTRTLAGGEVFIALEGTQVDGHTFIPTAFDTGAAAAIARRSWWSRRKAARAQGVHLLVDDPILALHAWGAQLRRYLNTQIIAVTGSSGKTTTKEMILALLRPLGETVGTLGNRNNQLGLPLSLLQIQATTQWAVLEMGTNQPGEIATLTRIAAPDVAVITCIGQAHSGPLGGPAGILAAKLEILEGLSPAGAVVIPDDDPALEASIAERWKGRVVRFGFSEAADVRARSSRLGIDGTLLEIEGCENPIQLRVLGEGGGRAALAALAVARALDLTAAEPGVLESVLPAPGRLDPVTSRGVTWLLDMYNASPESTLGNLRFLAGAAIPGHRIFVFGGMGELGEAQGELHEAVGRASGFCDAAVFVGTQAQQAVPAAKEAGCERVVSFDQIKDAARYLRGALQEGDLVLLKGARASGLEALAVELRVIKKHYGEGGA